MHLLKNPISYCKWPKKVQPNVRSKKGSQQGPETQLGLQDTNKTDISNVVQDPKKVLSLIAFSNLCDFDKQKQKLSFMFKEEPFPWENVWKICHLLMNRPSVDGAVI